MTEQQKTKKKRFRSPPYPSIDLGKAIERAAPLYKNALHHPVPMHVPANAWGYTTKSSGLFSALAALKQFGLIRDEGGGDKRRFTLTDDAIRIVRDPDPNSEKRRNALKRAALSPKIHAELWEKFGTAALNAAMDSTLKSYLTLDRQDSGEAPYSDSAADEIIAEFRATLAFAGLSNSDIISSFEKDEPDSDNLEDGGGGGGSNEEEGKFTPPDPGSKAKKVPIMQGERELLTGPLSKSSGFRLIVNGQVGLKEIERLISKLELEKDILSEPDEPGDEAQTDEAEV